MRNATRITVRTSALRVSEATGGHDLLPRPAPDDSIVGNLTDDPALRYTQSGKAVCNFTVAVSHREFCNGRSQEITDGFFPVTAWNALADNVAQSLRKGARVQVAGKLIQRSWQTDDGSKRTTVEISAAHVAAELSFASVEITKNSSGESPAPAEQAG